MKGLLSDCRHALRLYLGTPGASLIAVAGFAVAMAAVAAFVSLYVDLILRPHGGFEQSSRLITYGWNDGQNAGGLPLELIERIAEESVTIEAAAGTAPQYFLVGTDREPLIGEMVTKPFFAGVGPRLALGRGFELTEHEANGEPVVVISYSYWQRELGGRADVLGEAIEIRGQNQGAEDPNATAEGAAGFRIVGVMAPEFTGTLPPQTNLETMIWLPVEQGLPLMRRGLDPTIASISMRGIGRRARGIGVAAVARELNDRYIDELPNFTGRAVRFDVLDGLVFNANVQRNTQHQLELFLGGSILLALVAAANVTLFLLARAPGRRRELGIRMAVGAPLRRLARQLASEAAVLVIVATALGLALSVWLAGSLRGMTFLQAAQWRDVTLLDWRVIGLMGVIVCCLTALVSLAPILGLKRLGIAGSSRQIVARATVAQRVAGSAQIAVAGALGGAAVAFAMYLGSLMLADPGYATRNLHAAIYSRTLDVENGVLVGDPAIDYARYREAIMSLPGVSDVSIAGMVPGMQMIGARGPVPHPTAPNVEIGVLRTLIDARYVDVLGLRLVHGRSPRDADAGVMLVNQTLAREFFGREDVVGESLFFGPVGSGQGGQIVGVLEDLSYQHPAADVEPMAFLTSGLLSTQGLALIESPMTSRDLREALEALIESGALELAIQDLVPLETVRSGLIASDRARSFLTIGTTLLVVLLAGFGFYGTQRYLVTAGLREYAIRASLGAGPRALGRLVLWRGLQLGLPGLVLGLPLAFIVVAWLRDDYVSRDLSPSAVSLAVVAGLAAVLVAASLGPAAAARRTQPAPLLRQD